MKKNLNEVVGELARLANDLHTQNEPALALKVSGLSCQVALKLLEKLRKSVK